MAFTQKQIQRLFSPEDYKRGANYVRQGRVSELECVIVDGVTKVFGTVHGTQLYQVQFWEQQENDFVLNCTCPRFAITGKCKHLAAAMISYATDPPKTYEIRSDHRAQAMLQRYLSLSSQSVLPAVPARLVPKVLFDSYRGGFPAFSFRVGKERLYVVKDIPEFLRYVEQRRTVSYGKNLTLDHTINQFDSQSQKLIALLRNENDYPTSDTYRHHSYCRDESRITLMGESFDRMFDLLSNGPVESSDSEILYFRERDPEIHLQMTSRGHSALLKIYGSCPYLFFGNGHKLYAYGGNEVLRCSPGFCEKVYPLLEQQQSSMVLALSDLPTFCGCVLPEIADFVEVEDPDHLIQNFLPEECAIGFYLDLEGDTLSMKLSFRYGNKEFSPSDQPAATDGVHRDIKAETAATLFAEQFFQHIGDQFLIVGENAVFSFLIDSLDQLRQYGEVYLSDRLCSKRIQPVSTSVGISVSDGLLSLSMDTGGFPPEELSALYQSLLQRRKYHRLPDGRYLELNGSSYEKMAEMAHMLQLSKRELTKGTVTLPAYRGLYLDALLNDSEGILVSRDAQFRSMIRNFKAVSDGDYTLPESLEHVLRPYQKTGFQWLKTLETYGFGGILADEMGLGKTLQVIAFLATVPQKTVGHPNLVVCPASLIYNWGEELQKFAPQLSARLILGTTAERKALRSQSADADVWVTSYELLRQDIEEYESLTFYSCILDEAQHIKNSVTLASKSVKRISCRQRFVLTGTPIENRLSELWNLFDFLMTGYLFTNSAFREKLEKPIIKSKNPDASAQLRRLVQPFLLRRLKQDVLKELPPKEEHVRRIALSEQERKTYYACLQTVQKTIGEEQGKLRILAALTRLRQICCDPNLCFENYEGDTSKLDACIELCETMVENGHQILLFSQFTTMLDRIRSRLEERKISSFTLQGSTSKEKRAKLVKAFQAGEASVFLISLKAGGTGLNLTSADVVIHYDPWWNQAAQNQATDRAHRIGQQAHVQVYKLITKDTIEEKILELQDKKAALMDTISGAEETGILSMSKEDLLALLEIQ